MKTETATRPDDRDLHQARVLVVLAAHGEAESSGFRAQFAVSWQTLSHAAEVMPLPAPLRLLICTLGALRKALTGSGGSRHNAMTRRQAEALAAALADEPSARYRVRAAFASARPGVKAVVSSEPEAGVVLLQSMIPSDSRLACGLACRAVGDQSGKRTIRSLARLWEDPALIAVHRAHLLAQLEAQGRLAAGQPNSALVVVLHGTLLADKSGRAPAFHTGHVEKTRYGEALREALGELPERPWQRVEIAYLNHAVGGRWSQPELSDCLKRLADEGIDRVFTYPAEHLVDSAETDRLARVLDDSPIEHGVCLPCLNDSPLLIDFIAARVRQALTLETDQACDHCPLSLDGQRAQPDL